MKMDLDWRSLEVMVVHEAGVGKDAPGLMAAEEMGEAVAHLKAMNLMAQPATDKAYIHWSMVLD